jgi:hypothetical protein
MVNACAFLSGAAVVAIGDELGDDRQDRLLRCAHRGQGRSVNAVVPVERHDAALAGAARLNTSVSLSPTISASTSCPPSSVMRVAVITACA